MSSTRDSLKLLEEYEASRDWPSLAKLAHRMLPMFRQLHADRTAADLEELEKSYEHLCKLRDEVIEMGIIPAIKDWHALNPNID